MTTSFSSSSSVGHIQKRHMPNGTIHLPLLCLLLMLIIATMSSSSAAPVPEPSERRLIQISPFLYADSLNVDSRDDPSQGILRFIRKSSSGRGQSEDGDGTPGANRRRIMQISPFFYARRD